MIKNLGEEALAWLAAAISDIIKISKYPESWKHAKIIAILKPKKIADNPSSYRTISLPSCLYKLTERIILFRIGPISDKKIPIEHQAEIPLNKSWRLLSLVELALKNNLKQAQFSLTCLLLTTLYGTTD